jgi:hypothetical protein
VAVLGQHGQVPQHLNKRFNYENGIFHYLEKKYFLLRLAFGSVALFIEMWNINEMKVSHARKYL